MKKQPQSPRSRYNYRNALAVQWLRLHRPDIVDAIEEEVDAKFPARKRNNERLELPDKLRKAI